jgi:ATP-dependent Clp protease adapter protein ClpS
MLPQAPAASAHPSLDLRGVLLPPRPPEGAPRDNPHGEPPHSEPLFGVEVLDNPVNTYQEVIAVCLQALPVTAEEAFRMAYTIDQRGSCVVCVAPREQAEQVAATIRTIGIDVCVSPWEQQTP